MLKFMKLYAFGEDYLKAIFILRKKVGMARSVDVTWHMWVSKTSVCAAVNALKNGGFLIMDENVAGIDHETAEGDACRM